MDNSKIDKKLEQILDRMSSDKMSDTDREEILSELNSILEDDAFNTDALSLKGLLYEFSEQYEKAIEMYEEILKILPDDAKAKENIENCNELIQLNKNLYGINLNKNKDYTQIDLLEKVSIWHILIFKAVIIAIFAYFIFFID